MPNNFKPVHAESPHNTWLFTTHPNTNATANAPQKRTIKATKKITEKQTVKREVPGICLKPVRGLNWPNIYMYLQLFNCKYSPRKLSTVRSLCYLSSLLLKLLRELTHDYSKNLRIILLWEQVEFRLLKTGIPTEKARSLRIKSHSTSLQKYCLVANSW